MVVLPVAVVLALDAYRSLGHGISGGYLVARSGTVRRATVALQRGGVIGWTVKQSVFQRRAGVLTLTATTAAGAGAYSVYDAAEGEGLAFAAEAVPGVLEPFLVRGDGRRGAVRPRAARQFPYDRGIRHRARVSPAAGLSLPRPFRRTEGPQPPGPLAAYRGLRPDPVRASARVLDRRTG